MEDQWNKIKDISGIKGDNLSTDICAPTPIN